MRYFTIPELTYSHTAQNRAINNTPDRTARRNLEALADNILDPLRAVWGKPIVVTSGYRSDALNRAVGGSAASQHTQGRAADITAGTRVANAQLFHLIKRLRLPYDQLIWEKGDDTGPDWVHVSYSPLHRRQTLRL